MSATIIIVQGPVFKNRAGWCTKMLPHVQVGTCLQSVALDDFNRRIHLSIDHEHTFRCTAQSLPHDSVTHSSVEKHVSLPRNGIALHITGAYQSNQVPSEPQ